jgi:hypothetical protein
MRYIIEIRIDDGKPRTYPVDAASEEQAIERLKLRLPPSQRESFEVDSIRIDMTTVGTEEPFGIYTGE